jgi:phosphoribosylanthranilate isomerase
VFDWTIAARLRAAGRIIVSGGITPANVRTAVETAHPYGIDVGSGLESAPGVKDHTKVKALFLALREIEDDENRDGGVAIFRRPAE